LIDHHGTDEEAPPPPLPATQAEPPGAQMEPDLNAETKEVKFTGLTQTLGHF
jgi:hypothetical protein